MSEPGPPACSLVQAPWASFRSPGSAEDTTSPPNPPWVVNPKGVLPGVGADPLASEAQVHRSLAS